MYEPLIRALESGQRVVTGNKRLARNLARAYAEQQQAAGRVAWSTPDVLSWQAWTAQLWAASELSGGRASQVCLLSETESRVLWEEVARECADADDISSGASLALQAWKRVCQWQVAAAPEWSASGLSPDQQVYLKWQGAYRDRLAAGGWIDAALLEAELATEARAGRFDDHPPLMFAGFDTWTPAQQTLRASLSDRGVATVDAPEPSTHAPELRRVQCTTDRAELDQAARWARAQAEARPGADICVVVRDLDSRVEEARRVFMDVFCPDWRTRAGHQLPVNFSYGRPLSQQPRVAAALNALWLAQGDTDYQRFSLALRTPFLRGGRDEADARAQLDLTLRDQLGAAFRLRDAATYAVRYAPGFNEVLHALDAAEFNGRRSLADWIEQMGLVLKSAGWPGDETLDSMAHQELEAWHQLLRELAASSRVRGELTLTRALALLERLAGARLHQPESGAAVVQVMGGLEAAGHEFDAVWVTGMAAEDWPGPASPHPLLPFELQRRCQMPGSSPERELRYAERVIRRLMSSSPQVVFSWPGERDGQRLHPSGLIDAAPDSGAINTGSPAGWVSAMRGSAPVELLAVDQPLAWTPEARARGGAYLFRLMSGCPYRAFLELRLGATEIERPVTGLSYKLRGSLAHDVLEAFYKRYPDSTALRALSATDIEREFDALIRAQLTKLPGATRPVMRAAAELERQRLLPLLRQFVALDQARTEFRVVQVEADRPEVSVGPLTLRLKLDRVDELSSGARIVIDYKTGLVRKSAWNPASPGDMQLPLYATAAAAENVRGVGFAQLSAHEVKYDGLADAGVGIEGFETPDGTRTRLLDEHGDKLTKWEDLTAAWQRVLTVLAEQFAAGDCRFNTVRPDDIAGQWAVLSRLYDQPPTGAEGDDNG